MKIFFTSSILACSLLISGCITYYDDPSEETISGVVIDAETGSPITNASVSVWSNRKYILFPSMHMPKSGYTQTDNNGVFEMKIKDIFPINLQVDKDGEMAQSRIPFEEKNSIKIHFPNDFRLYTKRIEQAASDNGE